MLQLTKEVVRGCFPAAPDAIVNAFIRKQAILDRAGITGTQRRPAWFFANVEHECGGLTIKNLTENISYTHQRVAEVWPNRFSSARRASRLALWHWVRLAASCLRRNLRQPDGQPSGHQRRLHVHRTRRSAMDWPWRLRGAGADPEPTYPRPQTYLGRAGDHLLSPRRSTPIL